LSTKLFDVAEEVPHGMGVRYRWALPIPAVVKLTRASSRVAFSPRCVENQLYDLSLKNIIFISNMAASNDVFMNTFVI
jgi:hypothetical protein